jgi:hypothetical protein
VTSVPFEVSSMHVAGMARALTTLGYNDVLGRLTPETLKSMDDPYSNRWHPGQVLVEVSNALVAVRGPDALEAMSYTMTRQSFGAVLRPMMSVALALTGNNPASLFARVGDGLQVAMRGVDVRWREAEHALELKYPEPVPDHVAASWRGVARFLFELSGREGRLESATFTDEHRTVTFVFAW